LSYIFWELLSSDVLEEKRGWEGLPKDGGVNLVLLSWFIFRVFLEKMFVCAEKGDGFGPFIVAVATPFLLLVG
jgi:hypothetical protein